MAYKCIECGHIFEEGEQAYWYENRGEYWGASCSEKMVGCPLCKGDYEKTTPCEICGSEHLEDELFGGVCEECIDKERKNFDLCFELSSDYKSDVKINSLIASVLNISIIEEVLLEYIKENHSQFDCGKWIDEDIHWFGERLAEEVKKNENGKK